MNKQIEQNIALIDSYKATLTSTSLEDLAARLSSLKLVKARHTAEVIDLITSLSDEEGQVKTAEGKRAEARTTLSTVMATTLAAYKTEINKYLHSLGAAFLIEEIGTNYLGGSAKSDYAIQMRGVSLKASKAEPPFSITLSDGDKRTLAFAFFVASIFADPNLADKIIVVDDPVSSLDQPRRRATCAILQDISEAAEQLIVLTHDASLVREMRNQLCRNRPASDTSVHRLVRAPGDYTDFGEIDIDAECETDYFRNYRMVTDHVEASSLDARGAAEALRPLLEGHLHRRYPGRIASNTTLGSVITKIDESVPPSPLTHAKPMVDELRQINEYARQFHHASNPATYKTQPADDAVVQQFGRRVLAIIHGAFKPD